MNKTPRQIAFHEAGHTAIQLVFDQTPEHVTWNTYLEFDVSAASFYGDANRSD